MTTSSRARIWLFTLATVLLAPLLNFGIGLATHFDVASVTVYTFIPVGTFALCALACSGFLYACGNSIYWPDTIDLAFLMLASVGSIFLTYLVEYAYLIAWHGATAAQIGGFGRFVVSNITEAQYHLYSKSYGLEGPLRAGEGGFLIMLVRIPAAAAIAKAVHSSMVSRAVNMS